MIVYQLPSGRRMTRFDDFGMIGELKVGYETLQNADFRAQHDVTIVEPTHDEVADERKSLYKDANDLYLAWQTALSMRDEPEKILAREQAWKARVEEIRNDNPYPANLD